MGSLNRFDVEVETSGRGIGSDGGVSRVGEWTGLFAAETRDIVLVATEGLVLGGLQFETAKVGANDGPYEVVCGFLAFHCFILHHVQFIPEAMACVLIIGGVGCCRRATGGFQKLFWQPRLRGWVQPLGPFAEKQHQRTTTLPIAPHHVTILLLSG